MGIRGIDILKGYTMENVQEPGQDPTPSTPEDPAPSQPVEPSTPDTPADDDVAPDADEPGDHVLPEELQEHVETGDVPPDGVDKSEDD